MKRTNTISARIPAELEEQARAVAIALDMSLSDLINECLTERVARELAYAQRLSAALHVNQRLHGATQEKS